jgi:hypothetical protein
MGWISRSLVVTLVRAIAALTLTVPAIAVLPGCSAEKICVPGEVVVQYDSGGTTCEQPQPGDNTCPDGQILLKNPDSGRKGCIPNVYKPGRYADQLPPTPTT